MIITTGDDVSLSVTLRRDGSTFTIPPASEVKAVIVQDGSALSAEVTCSDSAAGADWANSVVVAEFTSAQTASLTTTTKARLEIQVDDNGKTTWLTEQIEIRAGVIA